MSKQTAISKNILGMKEWLLVPEAARYLSTLLKEEVNDADVLRLALDGHLKLSVYFVNHTYIKHGKVIAYKDPKYRGTFTPLNIKLPIDENYYIFLEIETTKTDGIWDLPMMGCERQDVEKRFQTLTGGPEVKLQSPFGTLVERDGGQICQLQAHRIDFEAYRNIFEQPAKSSYSGIGLPLDSVLVVRPQALKNFQDRFSQKLASNNENLDDRAETTYLNIIGAMLETFVHKNYGDINFQSETKLREFLGEKYAGFKGLTERTLAEKFAAAKKAIREDIG